MTMGRPRWLARAFPRPWRDRYGTELVDLLDDMIAEGQVSVRDRLDVVTAGVSERLRRLWGSLVGWRAVVSAGLVAGVATVVAVTAVATVRTALRVHATIHHAGVATPYEGTCSPSSACTLAPAAGGGIGTLTVTLDPVTGMVIAIEGTSLPSKPFTLSGTIPAGPSP